MFSCYCFPCVDSDSSIITTVTDFEKIWIDCFLELKKSPLTTNNQHPQKRDKSCTDIHWNSERVQSPGYEYIRSLHIGNTLYIIEIWGCYRNHYVCGTDEHISKLLLNLSKLLWNVSLVLIPVILDFIITITHIQIFQRKYILMRLTLHNEVDYLNLLFLMT